MQIYIVKGAASLESKSSDRNRELENFASLELRVCEVLLYLGIKYGINKETTNKIQVGNLKTLDTYFTLEYGVQ